MTESILHATAPPPSTVTLPRTLNDDDLSSRMLASPARPATTASDRAHVHDRDRDRDRVEAAAAEDDDAAVTAPLLGGLLRAADRERGENSAGRLGLPLDGPTTTSGGGAYRRLLKGFYAYSVAAEVRSLNSHQGKHTWAQSNVPILKTRVRCL